MQRNCICCILEHFIIQALFDYPHIERKITITRIEEWIWWSLNLNLQLKQTGRNISNLKLNGIRMRDRKACLKTMRDRHSNSYFIVFVSSSRSTRDSMMLDEWHFVENRWMKSKSGVRSMLTEPWNKNLYFLPLDAIRSALSARWETKDRNGS